MKAPSPETRPAGSPAHPLRILHLEDNATDAELLETLLRKERLDAAITGATTKNEFQAALDTGHFDLIISDYSLPGFDGLSALNLARSRRPETPFICLRDRRGTGGRSVEKWRR